MHKMAYKKSVYFRAKEIMNKRRLDAERQQEMRHSQAVMRCPELLDLEREIASYGAEVIKAVGMGADAGDFVRRLSVKSLEAQKKKAELLKNAGLSENYLEAVYNCPVCKDTGTHGERICPCYTELVRQLAREELEEKASLSKHSFLNFNVNNYPDAEDKVLGVNQREQMTNVLSFCKSYAADFSLKSPSLIMLGATGLGKTHLSLAIAGEALDRGYSVLYDSAHNIMNKLEAEHFGKDSFSESIREDLLKSDLLIIDDLGCEFVTQFTKAELYNIINSRILSSLPTIISTNCTARELEEKYTQRTASRILGYYYPLAFCGRDVRQIVKKAP